LGGGSGSSGKAITFSLAADLIASTDGDLSRTTWSLWSAIRVPLDRNLNFQTIIRSTALGRFGLNEGVCSDCYGVKEWKPSSSSDAPTITAVWQDTPFLAGVLYPLAAHSVIAHPGASNEYADVAWKAPVKGLAVIDVACSGASDTTTDVHALVRGEDRFLGSIEGHGATVSYLGWTDVDVGDIVELAIGPGSNGNYRSDATQIDVQVLLFTL